MTTASSASWSTRLLSRGSRTASPGPTTEVAGLRKTTGFSPRRRPGEVLHLRDVVGVVLADADDVDRLHGGQQPHRRQREDVAGGRGVEQRVADEGRDRQVGGVLAVAVHEAVADVSGEGEAGDAHAGRAFQLVERGRERGRLPTPRRLSRRPPGARCRNSSSERAGEPGRLLHLVGTPDAPPSSCHAVELAEAVREPLGDAVPGQLGPQASCAVTGSADTSRPSTVVSAAAVCRPVTATGPVIV